MVLDTVVAVFAAGLVAAPTARRVRVLYRRWRYFPPTGGAL